MEFFHKAKSVRLRSHHDKYLWAGEDEESVTQDRDGAKPNARWTVEFVEGSSVIRLKSVYDCYLTATDLPFLLGATGKKVLQTMPPRLDSSVEWEPIREGFCVKLKTRYGNYLRANGGLPPWRNSVTHDIPHRTITQDWVPWEVEIMQIVMPPPSPVQLESTLSLPSSPPEPDGRLIYYAIGDDNGKIQDDYAWPSLIFKGNDLNELTKKLEEETGLHDVLVCAHHPVTEKLYPLRLQLPPTNSPMHVVLVEASSKRSQGPCDSHCGGQILLSEALAPPTTTTLLCPNQKSHVEHRKKLDLFRISEKQCQSMEEELQYLKEQQASLQNMLKVTQVEALENKVKEFQNTIKGQESTIESLQKELAQKSEQLTFISDEKAVGEEALEASQNECNQLASLIKELDERMTQLTTALTTRTVERDNAILVEKQEADARMLVEDDLRKKRDDLICQLGLARNEQTRLQIELDKCRKEQQEDRLKLAEAHSDLEQNQKHLEMAEKDIDQLKSLITQLDATREELVGKIKSTMADQQLAENHVTELEAEVQRLVEEVEIRNAEISQLHSLVESLSTEEGHLRSEIEFQAQKLSQINEENGRLVSEASSLQRNLQSAEEKLQNAESENVSLKEHFSVLEENRMVVEDRCAAKSGELQVVAEDLRNAMCELQLLKNELLQMAGERENLFENLKKMNTKLQYFEQLVCVKDKDEKEFSVAYEKLSEEHQQLKLAAIEMDAQVQQYRFQLQNMEEVLQRTQATAKSLDEESRKAKSEWKNLGRQVDVMSHSLAQQSSVIDDLNKEKSALLAQLSMSKQKMLDMEQKHTNIVREAAAIESKNQILTSLIQEKMQEAETLITRFRMEHERVKELEQLLACMRAQEHQLALESKDSDAKAAMMKEKLLALEEEVRALHATKDAQKDELLHLQAVLREKTEYGNRRHLAVSTNKENQFHPVGMDSTGSKAKVHELELRTIALAADLSKTAALYKDCLARLQKAEAQCIEQKKEYEYVLSILSKVDDDRILLQQKCRVLVGGTERVDHLKSMKYSDRMVENPEVEVLEVKLQTCNTHQKKNYIKKSFMESSILFLLRQTRSIYETKNSESFIVHKVQSQS